RKDVGVRVSPRAYLESQTSSAELSPRSLGNVEDSFKADPNVCLEAEVPVFQSRIRRSLASALGILVVVVFLSSTLQAQEERNVRSDTSLKVGGLLALTGPGAEFSLDIRQGLELAIRQLEEQHEVSIELLAEDSRMEVAPSLTAFRRLRAQHDVRYFVVLGSGPVLALKPLLQQEQVFVSTSAAHQDVLTDDPPIIRHSNHSSYDAAELASYVAATLMVKNVTVLTLENEWSTSFSEELKRKLESHGVVHQEKTFRADDADLRPLILAAKAAASDAVIAVTFGPSLVQLMRAAKELQLQQPFVANIGFAITEGAREQAAKLALNSFHYQDTPTIPAGFRELFLSQFGREPSGYWALSAYTDMEMLVEAWLNARGSASQGAAYLKSLGEFKGRFETVTVGKDGDILIKTEMRRMPR
ncbi:MAG: ABC transporter substrate-binding protein, partial [Bdellovibrionales bacterium]|nr:ABC transporter substrate-binding protein [Bdellovibrionales bacterium]